MVLKQARDKGFGVAAPVVFNIESIRRAYALAAEMCLPLVFRTNKEAMDISETVYWMNEFGRQYPVADKTLFVDGISTYEEAVEMATTEGIGGVSICDELALDTEKGIALAKEILNILHIGGVSLQASVSEETARDTDRLKALLKECPVDIVKIRFQSFTEENAEEIAGVTKKVVDETGVLVCVEDFDLSPEANRVLRDGRISKFDVYENVSSKCMDLIEELYKAEENPRSRTFVDVLQGKALDLYFETIKMKMYDVGSYFIR